MKPTILFFNARTLSGRDLFDFHLADMHALLEASYAPAMDEKQFVDRLLNDSPNICVALWGGRLVGFTYARDDGKVGAFAVDEAFRGKRIPDLMVRMLKKQFRQLFTEVDVENGS